MQVKRKDESAAAEEEERTVSIIASLLLNCSKQASGGGRLAGHAHCGAGCQCGELPLRAHTVNVAHHLAGAFNVHSHAPPPTHPHPTLTPHPPPTHPRTQTRPGAHTHTTPAPLPLQVLPQVHPARLERRGLHQGGSTRRCITLSPSVGSKGGACSRTLCCRAWRRAIPAPNLPLNRHPSVLATIHVAAAAATAGAAAAARACHTRYVFKLASAPCITAPPYCCLPADSAHAAARGTAHGAPAALRGGAARRAALGGQQGVHGPAGKAV